MVSGEYDIILLMRIALDSGALSGGHAVRGIGRMVGGQIEALEKESKKQKDFSIDVVDFNKADLGKYDILHYPYFFPFSSTVPSGNSNQKVIVTIQDLIQLIYPKNYPPGIRGKVNFIKQKLNVRKIDGVITISETSKNDIVRFLGIDQEKIKVTYLAQNKTFKKL